MAAINEPPVLRDMLRPRCSECGTQVRVGFLRGHKGLVPLCVTCFRGGLQEAIDAHNAGQDGTEDQG